MYLNIQSVLANINHLITEVVCYNPALILLSEARTTADIEDFEVQVENYNIVRCDSTSRHTGGVVMYIRKDFKFRIVKKIVVDKMYWVVFIRIEITGQNWIIGCLYRSPSSDEQVFLDNIENWFEDVFDLNSKCILVGDFNFNYLNTSLRYVNQIKSFIRSIGVEQLVSEATRITNVSSTLIDYVLTNQSSVRCDVHDTPKISDHSLITIKLNKANFTNMTKRITFRNYCENNLIKLNNRLISCDWDLNSNNVDSLYDNIMNNLKSNVELVAPLKTINCKSNHLPWYDQEVINLARSRNEAYRSFVGCRDDNYNRSLKWERYKYFRNEVVNLLKYKRNQYYENKIDLNLNDPKKMWKTLKNLIQPPKPELPLRIMFKRLGNNIYIENDKDKAENFNSYFTDSILEIKESIAQSDMWSDDTLPLVESTMSQFNLLNMKSLKSIINKLDNKCNSEIVNNKVLKNIFQVIGHVILNLVNTSLKTGRIPLELKTSTITPIPKIINTYEAENFRPINTLPALEKVIELAVYAQVSDYIQSNNIIMEYQSGFRPNHSCETALQATLSKWKFQTDSNKYIIAIFLDFKRAFETIDINILLKKLEHYGFAGKVLDWFKDYLNNRSQITKINNQLSNKRTVTTGVPQGSVLGPLLFSLYLNDINFIEDCEFINLFADDTLITASDHSLDVAVHKINLTLENISKFLDVNKLKLNVQKTKAMIITTQYKYKKIDTTQINVKIYNEKITIVEEIKYLGFILDNTLTLKSHFNYIYKKICKKLFFLSRVSSKLTVRSVLTVYRTIIQPHFDYCASLLYLLDNNSIAMLQRLQNRGMRIVLRCNRYTPICIMLNALDWFSVKHRLYYFSMILIFKILHNLGPTYFNEYITYNHEIHNYPTRQNNQLYVPRTNCSRTMNSLFHKGLLQYNNLPDPIKTSETLQKFKSSLNKYIREMNN